METIEEQTNQETEQLSKGIIFCRKLVASKHQMQEEAQRDWDDPKMRAIFEDLLKKAADEKK